MKQRPKTVLELAAERADKEGSGQLIPWFKDDWKIIEAALRRAASSPALAGHLAKSLSALARQPAGKALRSALRRGLIPDAKQATGRAPASPALCMEMAAFYRALCAVNVQKGKAREIVANRHSRSVSRIYELIRRGEKLLDLQQSQQHTKN